LFFSPSAEFNRGDVYDLLGLLQITDSFFITNLFNVDTNKKVTNANKSQHDQKFTTNLTKVK